MVGIVLRIFHSIKNLTSNSVLLSKCKMLPSYDRDTFRTPLISSKLVANWIRVAHFGPTHRDSKLSSSSTSNLAILACSGGTDLGFRGVGVQGGRKHHKRGSTQKLAKPRKAVSSLLPAPCKHMLSSNLPAGFRSRITSSTCSRRPRGALEADAETDMRGRASTS